MLTYIDGSKESMIRYALRHADDRLILGHKISEWSGHASILEEDLALANIGLDLIGQSVLWYNYSAELENAERSADDIVYYRNEREYYNLLLTEQPNEDFAYTIVRQFFFDIYDFLFYTELKNSSNETFAAIAAKSIKESAYHLRHSSQWILRLGDGTEISNQKTQTAINDLWMFTGEMFVNDEIDAELINKRIGVDLSLLKTKWLDNLQRVFDEAGLTTPNINSFMQKGGRNGLHSENMGYILAELQFLRRSYPNAKW